MSLDVANAEAPESLHLDPNYPAIPIGGATTESTAAEAMTPQASEGFAVRATIEIEEGATPPETGINLAFLTSALGWTPTLDTANSWNAPGATTAAGSYPVDHGTMCAFDALIGVGLPHRADRRAQVLRRQGGNLARVGVAAKRDAEYAFVAAAVGAIRVHAE